MLYFLFVWNFLLFFHVIPEPGYISIFFGLLTLFILIKNIIFDKYEFTLPVFSLFFFSCLINLIIIKSLSLLISTLSFVLFFPFIFFLFKNTRFANLPSRLYAYLFYILIIFFLLSISLYFAYLFIFKPEGLSFFGNLYSNLISPLFRPWKYDDMALTETDLIPFFLLSFVLCSVYFTSKIIRFFIFILLSYFAILTGKSILVLALIVYILMSSANIFYSKILYLCFSSFVLFFPLIFLLLVNSSFIDEPAIVLITSGRSVIWAEAVSHLFDGDIFNYKDFFLGNGIAYVRIKEFYGEDYIFVSYHSAVMRLFLMNGFLFYFISLYLFILYFFRFVYDSLIFSSYSQRILSSFFIANFVVLITDGSIFYNFDFYWIFVLQIYGIFLIIKNQKN